MKKKSIVIITILILLVGAATCYFMYNNKGKKVVKNEQVDSIKGYDYKLYNNSTKLYKELYGELKKVLEDKELDKEKYAELVGEMFVADFYNLDNKVTNHDIGGVEFVHSTMLDNFKEKAQDTIYKYVKADVYSDRKQSLPVVKKIEDVQVEKTIFNMNNQSVDAYKVSISWSYEKDLGYQTKATLILVEEDNKISLVEIKEE